jgi:glycosyltransferase involved in cell wall biosynthesis
MYLSLGTLRKIYKSFPKLRYVLLLFDILVVPVLITIALLGRYRNKPINVGLGPHPLINNVYHKKALEKFGYKVKTFVFYSYFISDDFDIDASKLLNGIKYAFAPYYLFSWAIFSCQSIYIYFNGGPLGNSSILKSLEPWLLNLSNTKVVVMPYGGDVQNMLMSDNLIFRHAQAVDYPNHQRLRRLKIEEDVNRWIAKADHIISGCDWVSYMPMWDTLTLGHFSIDIEKFDKIRSRDHFRDENSRQTLKILHSPNHKTIKGSSFFMAAISELQSEGYDIELVMVEKVPNAELMELMASVDIVADQLIIGWYAMTCLEGMALKKPVLCYIDPKLLELYQASGLLGLHEKVPVIECSPWSVKEQIKTLYKNRDLLSEYGEAGYNFAKKHHSLETVGKMFDEINRKIGVTPNQTVR